MRGSLGKSQSRLRTMRRLLLAWYRSSARSLPWRKTRNPYRILISEVMLQQTQVNRVLIHYRAFLKRFPSLRSLSQANTASVLQAWRGLGYNNRAVRLRNLAHQVVENLDGALPRTAEALESLPGIGRYTANAIACFAHEQRVPVVDTNIHRVLSRLYPGTSGAPETWRLAEEILPGRNAYSWNQALMELGALVCTPTSPLCSRCPINSLCPSAFTVRSAARKLRYREPGYDGMPNRIYRGRIIETLRNLNGRHSISSEKLGKQIKKGFSSRDRTWLDGILSDLERDGLVRTRTRDGRRTVSFAE